jgi:hypothetical protein
MVNNTHQLTVFKQFAGIGGEAEVRILGTRKDTTVFETAKFTHAATVIYGLIV